MTLTIANVGTEFLVNTTTANSQANSQVVGLSSGEFVVIWEDSVLGTGWTDIKGQLFSNSGGTPTKLGGEFTVDAHATSVEKDPTITALSSTGFVVSWTDPSGTAGDTSSNGAAAQIYSVASGQAAKVGAAFLANTTTLSDQEAPHAVVLSPTTLAFIWADENGEGGAPPLFDELKGQLISIQGGAPSKPGGEVTVNTSTNGWQIQSSLAALGSSAVVAVWEDENSPTGINTTIGGDGSGDGVRGQVFSAAGGSLVKTGSEFLINTHLANNQDAPVVASLSDNLFVVAWAETVGETWSVTNPPSNSIIEAQLFSVSGGVATKVGSEFSVDNQPLGFDDRPSITALSSGAFVVAWESAASLSGDYNVRAQAFSVGSGTPAQIGSSFLVNTQTANNQHTENIAALSPTSFVVSWTDFSGVGGDTSSGAIKAQVFSLTDGPPSTSFIAPDFSNLLRTSASSSANASFVANLTAEVQSSQITAAQAVQQMVQLAASTTSVATMAYDFFTGQTPSSAGLDYLISSTGPNPNNLNSAYYAQFSTINRYINFASNLGKVGEGAASFSANYGSLSLSDALTKAYTAIFGEVPTADKVNHLLNDLVPDGLGGSYARSAYFASYGGDGLNGQGTKAAMVGWLLAEAVVSDIGSFATANDLYLTDLANNGGPYAVNLVGAYHGTPFTG